MVKIAPSLLSADFGNLQTELEKLEKAGADYIHFDVMDGNFVPNISFGTPILKSIKNRTNLPFDVHLMIKDPDKYIEDFVKAGASIITVHQESIYHLDRTIEYIKSFGIKAGVSLNPATPVQVIKHVLGKVDVVLIMSVNPGFGGQKFIEYTLDKIKELKDLQIEKGYEYIIEVDGGVNADNARRIKEAGAQMLVAGNGIFSMSDYKQAIDGLR